MKNIFQKDRIINTSSLTLAYVIHNLIIKCYSIQGFIELWIDNDFGIYVCNCLT